MTCWKSDECRVSVSHVTILRTTNSFKWLSAWTAKSFKACLWGAKMLIVKLLRLCRCVNAWNSWICFLIVISYFSSLLYWVHVIQRSLNGCLARLRRRIIEDSKLNSKKWILQLVSKDVVAFKNVISSCVCFVSTFVISNSFSSDSP